MAREETRVRRSNGNKSSRKDPYNVLNQKIRAALRKIWGWYSPDKKELLKLNRLLIESINKNGSVSQKKLYTYLCNHCFKYFSIKNIQVDHISPVGKTPVSIEKWGEWIEKLFCSQFNLQILCKTCHSKKTKKDKKIV